MSAMTSSMSFLLRRPGKLCPRIDFAPTLPADRAHDRSALVRRKERRTNFAPLDAIALFIGGCNTLEPVQFTPSLNQSAIVWDGVPAIVSHGTNSIVTVSPNEANPLMEDSFSL